MATLSSAALSASTAINAAVRANAAASSPATVSNASKAVMAANTALSASGAATGITSPITSSTAGAVSGAPAIAATNAARSATQALVVAANQNVSASRNLVKQAGLLGDSGTGPVQAAETALQTALTAKASAAAVQSSMKNLGPETIAATNKAIQDAKAASQALENAIRILEAEIERNDPDVVVQRILAVAQQQQQAREDFLAALRNLNKE